LQTHPTYSAGEKGGFVMWSLEMCQSSLSAGQPGAPRCSEAATGPAVGASINFDAQRAVRAIEAASEALNTLHELGEMISSFLSESSDDDKARVLLKGHHALSLQACNDVWGAMVELRVREPL
jgi:hypothetical protein